MCMYTVYIVLIPCLTSTCTKLKFKFDLNELYLFSAIYSIIDKVGPSYSYITVFVGLKGTSEELGLHAGNTHTFSG